MMVQKALHPRDDINSLYVSRKERRRGLASIDDNINISMRRNEDYVKKDKKKKRLITAIRNNKNNKMINRKLKWWIGDQLEN